MEDEKQEQHQWAINRAQAYKDLYNTMNQIRQLTDKIKAERFKTYGRNHKNKRSSRVYIRGKWVDFSRDSQKE